MAAETPTCRVEIHAADRDIIIEQPGPLKTVADRALALWRATAPKAAPKPGGFVVIEQAAPIGLMPTELALPNRLADREESADGRRRANS